MSFRVPTVKFMMNVGFTEDQAKFIRTAIQKYFDRNWLRLPRPTRTLQKISDYLNHCGVESIPAGTNQKSPDITYVNTGESDGTTVMWINHRFVIGNWGSIVERGNYS